jgi:hypothetical protein
MFELLWMQRGGIVSLMERLAVSIAMAIGKALLSTTPLLFLDLLTQSQDRCPMLLITTIWVALSCCLLLQESSQCQDNDNTESHRPRYVESVSCEGRK